MECFGRFARLTVDDVEFDPGFRVAFRIEKTADQNPNTADITISNLQRSTREKLQRPGVQVILEAGYQNEHQVVFKGDARTISHVHDGPTWTTRIQCGDGEKALKNARVNESFGPGTDVREAARKAMEAMGLEMRDAMAALGTGGWGAAQERFWHGLSVTGPAGKVLSDALGGSRYRWSIQDGVLQVLADGETTNEEAVLLDRWSGLIGSPELGDNGVLKIRALLNGGLRPGRRVLLESDPFRGAFRVETAAHLGDTGGVEWYSEIEASPL